MSPYYSDEFVTLYHGDCRELLPSLSADVCVTDPPYGETSLAWDRWPDGWPSLIPSSIAQLWCFGSLRMFLDRRDEFKGWQLAQDIVWQKPKGSAPSADRFMRVHEIVTHWYRGEWRSLDLTPVREATTDVRGPESKRSQRAPQWGQLGPHDRRDNGTRLVRSVIPSEPPRLGRHPTEKPTGIIEPLIAYSCPPDGLVLDPFAGSGSTLDAARRLGRRAVGVEADEGYCEVIANRLSQGALNFGGAA